MKTLKELLDRRNAVNTELKTLEETRAKENREFSDDESAKVDKLMTEREELDASITQKRSEENAARQARLASMLANSGGGGPNVRGPEPGSGDRRRDPVENPDPTKYNILRAIRCIVEKKPVDGYEGEISQEIANRSGKVPEGFYLPMGLPVDTRSVESRDIQTSDAAGLIYEHKLWNRFIDVLRNRMVLGSLGATMLPDMVGEFDIPKQTAASTAYWVGEAGTVTGSTPTFGQISFTPTTVGAYSDITRRLLKQTSMAASNLVVNDLTRVLAIEVDRAGINGSGSSNQPEGILQNSSITTVPIGTNGGDPTWALAVALESTVAAANGDINAMAYLTSAVGRGKLKTTVKESGYPDYLWDRDNMINGYRAAATNQVPSNLTKGSGTNLTALIFGDFSTVHIAYWGGVDITVDPYALATSGGIRLVALLDTQIKFRNTESLAKIVDMVRT